MKWFKNLFFRKKKSNRIQNNEQETEIIKVKFPCKVCVVRAACQGKLCKNLEFNGKKLRDFIEEENCCPDCGGTKFYEGPCGGAAQNIQCATCGHWFNCGLPLFFERIHVPTELLYLTKE